MGFPMEMDKFPSKIWIVSHKPVAFAAGLGMMGIHRNVIHPKFGNFILLGTVLVESEVTEYTQPIDDRSRHEIQSDPVRQRLTWEWRHSTTLPRIAVE